MIAGVLPVARAVAVTMRRGDYQPNASRRGERGYKFVRGEMGEAEEKLRLGLGFIINANGHGHRCRVTRRIKSAIEVGIVQLEKPWSWRYHSLR